MDRLLLTAAVVAVVVIVAVVLARRRRDAPTQLSWTVPTQLDRRDFTDPQVPWLVVAFTSATCDTCRSVADAAEALRSPQVAVQIVEVSAEPDLHRRYGIDAVPTLVVANADGLVVRDFVGPVRAADLWGALAELRA